VGRTPGPRPTPPSASRTLQAVGTVGEKQDERSRADVWVRLIIFLQALRLEKVSDIEMPS
jgi:hypothetical protein